MVIEHRCRVRSSARCAENVGYGDTGNGVVMKWVSASQNHVDGLGIHRLKATAVTNAWSIRPTSPRSKGGWVVPASASPRSMIGERSGLKIHPLIKQKYLQGGALIFQELIAASLILNFLKPIAMCLVVAAA